MSIRLTAIPTGRVRTRTGKVRAMAPIAAGQVPDVRVKVASTFSEWQQAFELVTRSYCKHGYEPPDSRGIRFTPYHALEGTVTLVAKRGDRVLASFSIVPDNPDLGLPMESIYSEELRQLRQGGRRLAEVTTFAMEGLSVRDLIPTVSAMVQVGCRYMIRHHRSDVCLIAVRCHHALFYTNALGFRPCGPRRVHPKVYCAPREVEPQLIETSSLEQVPLTVPIFEDDLVLRIMPLHWAWYFAHHSSEADKTSLFNYLAERTKRSDDSQEHEECSSLHCAPC